MDRILVRRKVNELAEAIILKGKLLCHTESIYEENYGRYIATVKRDGLNAVVLALLNPRMTEKGWIYEEVVVSVDEPLLAVGYLTRDEMEEIGMLLETMLKGRVFEKDKDDRETLSLVYVFDGLEGLQDFLGLSSSW